MRDNNIAIYINIEHIYRNLVFSNKEHDKM